MERISDEEMFRCSLISEFPYSKVRDVIKEACNTQLEADRKEEKRLLKIIEWFRDREITPEEARYLLDTCLVFCDCGDKECIIESGLIAKLKPIKESKNVLP